MKKLAAFYLTSLVLASSSLESKATINFFDDFGSYINGNLVGQGPWLQTGASATTPIQVNSGTAIVGTSGQDVYAALTSPISITDGSTFYIGVTLSLTAAQAAGDYFLNWSTPVGTTGTFQERFYAKSSGAGFVFGYDGSSGGTVNYGSTVLNFNNAYTIVLAYTGVAGTLNDTFALYVSPTDTAVEANNTAYMTSGYIGTGAEQSTVSAINLRQGTAANAPSVIIDALSVGTTFAEVAPMIAPVPEPSTLALATLGGVACLFAMRRKR